MGSQQKEADPLAAVAGDRLPQAAGAARTTHFALRGLFGGIVRPVGTPADLSGRARPQQTIVHPDPGHWFAMAAFTLSNLVLVVRKHEIQPAARIVEEMVEEAADILTRRLPETVTVG